MKKNILLALLLLSATIQAQNVGIGTSTPAASAKLDVTSTNSGILIPRVALTMTTAAGPVTAPATSLLVYNTATVADVTPGFYYWDGAAWVRLNDKTGWQITGNTGIGAANFLGSINAADLNFRTANVQRAVITAAGNMGIGIAAPAEKLHVSDATTPNAATIRASGLSSTTTIVTNTTDVMIMADANGALRRANETVKDAWYTTGNATTGVRNIGTTTNFAYQFIANNIVRGRVNPADGEFVWGGSIASPYAGDALSAVANATLPFALNGYSAQNGSGTWGEILAASTTAFSAVQGVYGGTGAGAGVLGNYNGTNTSNTRAGVVGVNGTTANGGAAVYGNYTGASGNQHIGVLGGYNGTAFGIGVHGIGFGGGIITGNNDAAVVGWRANNANYSGYFNGNHVIANGTKSASVGTSKGNQLLYCMESPEVWFEDFGVAYLVNGKAEVKLDELFMETVLIDEEHPMHVFVQVQGECNDVYVITGTDGFTVVEKEQGQSNIKFSYRLVAKRATFPDHRFGNDPVWKDGDTRQYSDRAPKRPIDYNEAVKQDEEMKKNWKPVYNPAINYPTEFNLETERDPATRNKEQK